MIQEYQSTIKTAGTRCKACNGEGIVHTRVTTIEKHRALCDRCGRPSPRLAPARVEGDVAIDREPGPAHWIRVTSRDGIAPEQHYCDTCFAPKDPVYSQAKVDAVAIRVYASADFEIEKDRYDADFAAYVAAEEQAKRALDPPAEEVGDVKLDARASEGAR